MFTRTLCTALRSTVLPLLSSSMAALVCSSAWAGTLQGSAMYRERIALPPEAVFEARLLDISKADAPAVVLGSDTLDPAGQPPFQFSISYDAAAVQAGHRYVVQATVRQQDRLLFTTDQQYRVLDGSNTPLDLRLVAASHARETPAADSPLRGTYWKLVRLGEHAVTTEENQREAHLLFASDALRVTGSTGCNRVTGGFELDGEHLQFSLMAGTMMACLAGMDQEKRFLEALKQVQGYRIRGGHLALLTASGEAIASFDGEALK